MTPDPTIQASFDASDDAATFTDRDDCPAPERPDADDAYIRCIDCSRAHPITSTDVDDRCDCGGILVYAIGEWEKR